MAGGQKLHHTLIHLISDQVFWHLAVWCISKKYPIFREWWGSDFILVSGSIKRRALSDSVEMSPEFLSGESLLHTKHKTIVEKELKAFFRIVVIFSSADITIE